MLNAEEVKELLKENPPKTGLDYIMRVRGITNEALASQVRCDSRNVSGWRNGRIPRTREQRQEIARILSESEYFLFFQETDWEQKAQAS